jgi:hypothetical protein
VLERVREQDFEPTLATEHLASDDWKCVPRCCGAGGSRRACGGGSGRGTRIGSGEPKAHFGELVQLDGSFQRLAGKARVTRTVCYNWNGRVSTGSRPQAASWCARNETGEIAMHDRGRRLGFRELPVSSTARPHPPHRFAARRHQRIIRGARLRKHSPSSLLSYMVTRGHFYYGESGTFLMWYEHKSFVDLTHVWSRI